MRFAIATSSFSEFLLLAGSLRVINQQLWCCRGDAGIMVFYSELQQQRIIPCSKNTLLQHVVNR